MGEAREGWRVSEVLRDSLRKQRVAVWEQVHAATLTSGQRRVRTKIATAVQDSEVERLLDGDRPLAEISQDDQAWAEFVDDHKDLKKRYNRLMARAVRHGLFAYPQYCRRYYRDCHDKVRVRFVVLNDAHPLVLEWVGGRRALGGRKEALHRLWRTHPQLEQDLPAYHLLRPGAVDLAEEVVQGRRNGKSWNAIFCNLSKQGLLLRNKRGEVTQNTWQALHQWAIDHAVVEALPPEVSQREAREIQQREAHELQHRAEVIRTLELTPHPNGGYVARADTVGGDQVEVQERDGIGALIKLNQSLWYRYPGEQPQQGSDP